MLDGLTGVSGEVETAGLDIAQHHALQPRLEDGNLALLEAIDLGRINVHADHVMADIGQTGASHQAYVACSEDSDFHVSP